MIESPAVIVEADPGRLDDLGNLVRERRIARGWVLNRKQLLGKAVEIVDGLRTRHGGYRRRVHKPMCGDHENSPRSRSFDSKRSPGFGIPIVVHSVHGRAMSKEHGGHRVVHHDWISLLLHS